MEQAQIQELKVLSRELRKESARIYNHYGSGHIGGTYSCMELMIALYERFMHVDPRNPQWEDRDRFLMGKGHSASILYVLLSRKGFFPREWLDQYCTLGANLNVHPSMHKVPGCDMSSGSLGHCLSVGMGMALAAKIDDKKYHTYVLLGDGECHEGMIWEAAMAAPKFGLDNLIAIVDRNGFCLSGRTEYGMIPLDPFGKKWEDFGWNVLEIDGHDYEQILEAYDTATRKLHNGKPTVILANTIKGKGVSFIENDFHWHSHKITDEIYAAIVKELDEMN